MLQGRQMCAHALRPTRTSQQRNPVTPFIPTHSPNSPATPIIPALTQTMGVGGTFHWPRLLTRHSLTLPRSAASALTPLFPLHSVHSPATLLFPLHTRNIRGTPFFFSPLATSLHLSPWTFHFSRFSSSARSKRKRGQSQAPAARIPQGTPCFRIGLPHCLVTFPLPTHHSPLRPTLAYFAVNEKSSDCVSPPVMVTSLFCVP
jgi:hypothetical protein